MSSNEMFTSIIRRRFGYIRDRRNELRSAVGYDLNANVGNFIYSGECEAVERFRFISVRNHSSSSKEIALNWKLKDGTIKTVQASVGWTYLDVAHKYEIDLEGACAGVCACSTCHLIFDDDVYDDLSEATEAEDDMLDQAFQLTHTSRLGCQIIVKKEHAGTTVQLPAATRNFYVDGHIPKPH